MRLVVGISLALIMPLVLKHPNQDWPVPLFSFSEHSDQYPCLTAKLSTAALNSTSPNHIQPAAMKQRITYLVRRPESFNPEEQLVVKDGSLTLNGVEAAKEHRVTFSLSELPQEVGHNLY
jgi:hypothetical protein